MKTPLAVAAVAFTLSSTPSARAADVAWVLELPLTQGQGAVDAWLQSHGGTVSGGTFSAQGWTTTSRGDFIEVPLPAGIDARRGVLELTFQSPELSGPTGYFESFILLTLDEGGAPFQPTPTGQAGIQSMYIAWNELDQPLKKLKGYLNLFDAGCSDWQLCTGEAGSGNGWLGDGSGSYTIAHNWAGAVDQLHMTGGSGNVNKAIDLTATSPGGTIAAPQLVLAVNPCGGSSHNACGQWDGPVHGGPLGVTYSAVRLELLADCGDGSCTDTIEDCQSCPADCCGGVGGAGGGAQGGGQSTGGASTGGGAVGGGGVGASGGSSGQGGEGASSSAGGAGGASTSSGADTSDDGGCQLGGGRGEGGWWWLLATALAASMGAARRRARAAPAGRRAGRR